MITDKNAAICMYDVVLGRRHRWSVFACLLCNLDETNI